MLGRIHPERPESQQKKQDNNKDDAGSSDKIFGPIPGWIVNLF